MKVCPVCQASFAEGFVYCPRDAELLVRYDLRTHLRRAHEPECNFLLTTESFQRRLWRTLQDTLAEWRADPRGFWLALARGEGSSRRRKQVLQAGVALALIGYTFVVTGLLLLGLQHSTKAEQLVQAPPTPEPWPADVRLVTPMMAFDEVGTRPSRGHLGGSAAQPQRTSGGGGGGDNQAKQASGGTLPHASLLPQQAIPDPAPPKTPNPTLVQVPSLYADPMAVKFVAGQTGVPDAPPAPPARGQGTRGGLGGGDGTGIGVGTGPGYNAGEGGNMGNQRFGIGGGPTTGSGHDSGVPRMANLRLRPTILYKEKARYAEEARQQKVQGTVLLMATFNANGTLSDIRVVRGLPFGLTEEAIISAKRIRFQPAVENGVPVTVRAQLEYNFALY